MSSSTLHNPQQTKQKPVKEPGMGQGTGTKANSSLGTGTGKVINAFEDKTSGKMSKKKGK